MSKPVVHEITEQSFAAEVLNAPVPVLVGAGPT